MHSSVLISVMDFYCYLTVSLMQCKDHSYRYVSKYLDVIVHRCKTPKASLVINFQDLYVKKLGVCIFKVNMV